MPKPSKPSSSPRTAPSQGKGSSSAKPDRSVSSKGTKSKEHPSPRAKPEHKQGESIGSGVVWLVIGAILLGFGSVGFLVYQELLNGAKRELSQTAQAQAQPILKQFEQVRKTTENLAGKLQAVQNTKPKTPDPYRKAVIDQANTVTPPLMGLGMFAVPNQLFKGNGPAPYVLRKEGATIPQGTQTQALPAPNEKLVAVNRNEGQKLPILTNSPQPSWTNTYDSYGAKVIAFTIPLTNGKQNVAAAYGELHLGQLAQSVAANNLNKTNPDTTVLLVSPDGMIWGNTSSDGGGQAGQSYQTIPSLSNAWTTLQTQGAVQSEGKLWVNTPLGISGWQVVAGTSEQKIWLRILPIVGVTAAGTLVLAGGGMFWFLGSLRRRFSSLGNGTGSPRRSEISHTSGDSNLSNAVLVNNDPNHYGDNTAGDLSSLHDSLNLELEGHELEYPKITTDLSVGTPASGGQDQEFNVNQALGVAAVGVAVVGGVAMATQNNASTSSAPQAQWVDPSMATSVTDFANSPQEDLVNSLTDDLPLDDLDEVPAENLMADYADKYSLALDELESVAPAITGTNASDANPSYAHGAVENADANSSDAEVDLVDDEELNFGTDLSSERDVFASAPDNLEQNLEEAGIETGVYDDAFAPISDSDALSVGGISEEEMLAMELAEANLAMDHLNQQSVAGDSLSDDNLSDSGFHFKEETILQSSNAADNELVNPLDMDYVPAASGNYTDDQSDPFAPDPFQSAPSSNAITEVDPFGTMDLLGNVDRRAVEEESQLEAFDPLMETIGQNVMYNSTDEVFEPLPPLVPELHESLDSIDSSEGINSGIEEIGEPDWGQAKNEFAQPYSETATDQNYESDNYGVMDYEAAAELLEDQFVSDEEYAQYDQLDPQQIDAELGQGNMDYAPESYDPMTYDPAAYDPTTYDPAAYDPATYTDQNYDGANSSLDYGVTEYPQESYPAGEYAPTEYPTAEYTEYATDPYAVSYAEGYVQGMEIDQAGYSGTPEQFQYSDSYNSGEDLVDYQSSYQTDEYGQTYTTDDYVAQGTDEESAYAPQYDQEQLHSPHTDIDYSNSVAPEQQYTEQQYAAQQYSEEHHQFNYDDPFASGESSASGEVALPDLGLAADLGMESEETFTESDPFAPAVADFAPSDLDLDSLGLSVALGDDLSYEQGYEQFSDSLSDDLNSDLDNGLGSTLTEPETDPFANLTNDLVVPGLETLASNNLEEFTSNDFDNELTTNDLDDDLNDDFGSTLTEAETDPFATLTNDLVVPSLESSSNDGLEELTATDSHSDFSSDPSSDLISMGDETAFSFASLEDSLMSSTSNLEMITSGTTISDLPELSPPSLPNEIDLDFLNDGPSVTATPENSPTQALSNSSDSLADFPDLPDFSSDNSLDDIFENPVMLPFSQSLAAPQPSAEPSSDLSFLDVLTPSIDDYQENPGVAIEENDPFMEDPFADSVFAPNSLADEDDLGLDTFSPADLVSSETKPQNSIANQKPPEELIMPAIPDLNMELGVDLDSDGFFDSLSNDNISNSLLELQLSSKGSSLSSGSSVVQKSEIDEFDFGDLSLLDDEGEDLLLDDLVDGPSNHNVSIRTESLKPSEDSWDNLTTEDDFNFDDLMLEIDKPLSPKPDPSKSMGSQTPESKNSDDSKKSNS
ncbi:MAG: hypothetical protein ACK456_07575 [Pseudanabaenaceae cyanobacterium]